MLLDFAFPDLVAAEGVESVFVLAADGDAGDAATVRNGEDDLSGAVVGADLDTALGGDELTAFESNTFVPLVLPASATVSVRVG